MEIAGFPQWENVYSNILAFLVDTEQVHGFGQLFIRSIMAAYRNECPKKLRTEAPDPDLVEATDRVEREVTTATNRRIDIIIECAGFLVCIENKIWSALHNDLGDYRDHCEKHSGERPVIGIVLSPRRVASQSLKTHHFVNVTSASLVDEVRPRMGNHIGRHNSQYQYLLLDFLEQANRFSEAYAMTDDKWKFLEFWRDHEDKISNIQSMCDEIRHGLRAKEKAQAHIIQCMERLTPSEQEVFNSWIYAARVSVFDLADKGYIDGCGVFLDVRFHPLRVSHVLGKRRGRAPNALASRIGETCGITFDTTLEQPEVVNDQSPFDPSVCQKAVNDSVAILKAIAALRVALRNANDA